MAEEITSTQQNVTESGHSAGQRSKKLLGIGILLVVIVLSVILVALLKKEPAAPTVQGSFTPAPTATINITASGFQPATILVKKGTIVTWTNMDNTGHSVTNSPNAGGKDNTTSTDLKSDPLIKGQVYHYKFLNSGTYYYHDAQNPTNNATVTVQ